MIDCNCGYKYYFDHVNNKWITKSSKYDIKPKIISRDLKLIACPECGNVFYDIHDYYD